MTSDRVEGASEGTVVVAGRPVPALILRPSRRREAGLAVACLVFAMIGIGIFIAPDRAPRYGTDVTRAIGVVCTALFGVVGLRRLRLYVGEGEYVAFTPSALILSSWLGRYEIDWTQVASVRVWSVRGIDSVRLRLEQSPRDGGLARTVRLVDRLLSGTDVGIGTWSLGVDAVELAEMIERSRRGRGNDDDLRQDEPTIAA